jgi:hypothetical protein
MNLLNLFRRRPKGPRESIHVGRNVVEARIIHADGSVTELGKSYNLLTNGGRDDLAAAFNAVSFNARYMGITTNTAAPAATDTTLVSEQTTNGLSRVLCTYAHSAGTATLTMTANWNVTGTVANLHKIGIFDAVSGGTLVFVSDLNSNASVVSGDTLQVVDTITLSG